MSITEELQAVLMRYVDDAVRTQADEFYVQEALKTNVLRLEDVGWTKIGANPDADNKGLDLDALHQITPDLRDMAARNPLHVRGNQLIKSYVFGDGITFDEARLNPRAKRALRNPYNKESLFSVAAYETITLEEFAAGNLVVLRDSNDIFSVVPIEQISGVITDPFDNSKVRYLQRTWTLDGKDHTEWYPLARWKNANKRLPATIKNSSGDPVPVSRDTVAYFKAKNRQAGWTFGLPLSLAAKVYTLLYDETLKDSAILHKALSTIAWTATNTTARGARATSVAVENARPGGTASMAAGNELKNPGVPSSQVNYDNSQPIAALVASSFGVPVIALLSSPGAGAGSYGTAQTLDTPTTKGMKAHQDAWIAFFEEILTDLGVKDPIVSFPPLDKDPAYRQVNSIGQGVEMGAIWMDEARQALKGVIDFPMLHVGPPPAPQSDYVSPKQGVTGSVPGGVNQGTTNHDSDGE